MNQNDQGADITEIRKQQQTLYDGESSGATPVSADTAAWLTEGTNASIPINHRKSSDGAILRVLVEAISSQNAARFEENSQDPLDTTPQHESGLIESNLNGAVQQSPFGTLIIPSQSEMSNGSATRLRQSITVQPHWRQTPRILIVEDDVVYRQLSSKILEKFGCVTETVDDAQGAIEKMNRTKYDLVLMDIFFGPSMDGSASLVISRFELIIL